MNGNMIKTDQTRMDTPSETNSGIDEVVNSHTFKRAPKNISRYPSVKNLKKLLKKYEDMILEIFNFTLSHLAK
jgi:hypothetical protein